MSNYKKSNEKKCKEDKATAFAFQEFIESFQNVAPTSKPFIKSGIYTAGNSEASDTILQDKGKIYNPSPIVKVQPVDSNKKALECARLIKEIKYDRIKGNAKPKSNLELLKEELRIRHLSRDVRGKQKQDEFVASPEKIVDTTTNLFLTNLNPKLNEQDLLQICGLYGPLASVKIMWPRADDRTRNSNVGFVAFMSRKDSEKAYEALSTRDDMRVTWGKAIEIPAQPIFIPPELIKMMLPPPYSGLPFNAQPSKNNFKYPDTENDMNKLLNKCLVKVTIPLDKKILMLIHRVIEFVIREGPMFEAMLMHKEINNPSFQFLFDNKTTNHVYYRWKLYSIMIGENHLAWSMKPFRMFTNGSMWLPPKIPDFTKGMDMYKIDKIDYKSLSDWQQQRLIQTIQQLTTNRNKIGEAMVFCLNHAEASRDIVNIISESFENSNTIACKKVARLFLVSDILYNSKFKKYPFNNYQAYFEARLINIFENLEVTYKKLTQNEKDLFRVRILKVLRAWELWKAYSSDLLDKLETILFGESTDVNYDSDDAPLDGKLLIARSMNCLKPCTPTQTEIIKTEVTSEDLLDEKHIFANFVQSKWETLDPSKIESQAMSTKKLHDLEMARIEKERRKREKPLEREKLRQIELKVLQYQDDLESGRRKSKNRKNLDEEIDDYRRKYLEKFKRAAKYIETSPVSTDSFSSDDSIEREKRSRRRKKLKKGSKYH